nr:putative mating pair formation protein TrbL [uncultured bacterium]
MALREQRFTLSVVLLLLASVLLSTNAMAATDLHDPSGSFTGLLDLVKNSASQWDGKLKGYAERLFWMLALIQFIWTFMPLIFKQADFGEIVGELVRFIMVIGFFWALLQFASEWAEAVVNSFRQAGASAAGLGQTAIRPGDIFGTAIELANTIGDVETWNPLVAFMVALAGMLVLLCFAFIAAFMGLTIIESYVVINASVLFMGFGASQWTREYAMAIVRYAVSVGAKLFILTLIVGLITDSAKQWQAAYNHDDASMWTMIGLAFACAYFAKTIPELVAGMISGASMGGGSSVGGMAAAGAAGAAAAIATIATAGAAAPAAAAIGAGGTGAGAAGTAGGLASSLNSSMAAGATSAGGGATSAGGMASSAGVGTSTGGGAAAKGASSAGSRVGGSTANAAPSPAPAQPSSGVQQAAKQAGKAMQGGDDDKSQPAPGSASSASSGDSSASSAAPSSAAETGGGDGGSSDSAKGGVTGRQVAEGMTKGLGLMSAIAVPGMESAAGLSLGAGQPQPTPSGGEGDTPSMESNAKNEPENVIRPADTPPPSTKGE